MNHSHSSNRHQMTRAMAIVFYSHLHHVLLPSQIDTTTADPAAVVVPVTMHPTDNSLLSTHLTIPAGHQHVVYAILSTTGPENALTSKATNSNEAAQAAATLPGVETNAVQDRAMGEVVTKAVSD